MQEEVPEHTPFHPVNVLPDWGVAESETEVPKGNEAEQVPEVQLSPEGTLVTVPDPLPENETLKVFGELDVLDEKIAETEAEEVRVTTQLPVPEHIPPHPEKLYPLAGVAARVTEVP